MKRLIGLTGLSIVAGTVMCAATQAQENADKSFHLWRFARRAGMVAAAGARGYSRAYNQSVYTRANYGIPLPRLGSSYSAPVPTFNSPGININSLAIRNYNQPTNLMENRIGNTTFVSGFSGGQPVNLTEQHIGNMTFVSGMSGGANVNLTEQHIGNSTFVNGMAGGQNVNMNAMQVTPNMTTVSGTQGGQYHNYSLNTFGNVMSVSGY